MEKKLIIRSILFVAVAIGCGYGVFRFSTGSTGAPIFGGPKVDRKIIANMISESVQNNQFPEIAELPYGQNKLPVQLHYTFDDESHKVAEKIFHQYKPDYAALVMMDAKTGKIISTVSYTKEPNEMGNLTLRATFPSASVFKMVTATAALDRAIASVDSKIEFNGANHTLYKKNVMSEKHNRWTRFISIREAFAKSINTVFAKIGMNVGAEELKEYAQRFKFNQEIMADLPVQPGVAPLPTENMWKIAEIASGYTQENRMSPLQGSMMAAAVVNDGVMMAPFAVESLSSLKDGEVIYKTTPLQSSVTMKPETARELRVLMAETVEAGTSRKFFRDFLRNKKFKDIEVGGKTGSLTGNDPKGKCDWFVGYAEGRNQKIAISVLTVNKEKWAVKSSYVAKLMLQDYFVRNTLH